MKDLVMGDLKIVDRAHLGVDILKRDKSGKLLAFVNDKGADALAKWLAARSKAKQAK